MGFVYEPHYDFVVDTSTLEIVNERMGKSRKRDVNASFKQGVSVSDNPSDAEVNDYYYILKELYTKKVKTPLFPKMFFECLWKAPFSKYLLVKYQDEVIGGTACVYDEETVYEWFACGKDGAFKNVFPSTVATWSGIRFAVENGFKRFDMMGAGAPGDGGYGVRDFKAKFGGELVNYGRFRHVCAPLLYSIGVFTINLLKKK
jgi:lipid II:glycine glycyltransferase (peptidoglycan interpeptide bridge formation enzyme)